MEDKVFKMEKDIALLVQNQNHMSKTLDLIVQQLAEKDNEESEIKLVRQRLELMDREIDESFKRADKRMSKIEAIPLGIARIIGTIILMAFMGLLITKG